MASEHQESQSGSAGRVQLSLSQRSSHYKPDYRQRMALQIPPPALPGLGSSLADGRRLQSSPQHHSPSASCFSQGRHPRRTQAFKRAPQMETTVFYDLILKVTSRHSCHILLVTWTNAGAVWEKATMEVCLRQGCLSGSVS